MLRYYLLLPFILSCLPTMVYGQANDTNTTTIECDENGCKGTYYGPEFINGSDVAHQFSNTMSHKVGDKLKEYYNKGLYTKVDFASIKMTTLGMGSGMVTYKLLIPFISVTEPCDAFTSFDHVGGWNHAPLLAIRKKELSNVLLPDDELHISDLKTTPEGLQEYWIQWRNKATQENCK